MTGARLFHRTGNRVTGDPAIIVTKDALYPLTWLFWCVVIEGDVQAATCLLCRKP